MDAGVPLGGKKSVSILKATCFSLDHMATMLALNRLAHH